MMLLLRLFWEFFFYNYFIIHNFQSSYLIKSGGCKRPKIDLAKLTT